ncbi:MAG: hypothetical protein AB1847_07160 [bacterium]
MTAIENENSGVRWEYEVGIFKIKWVKRERIKDASSCSFFGGSKQPRRLQVRRKTAFDDRRRVVDFCFTPIPAGFWFLLYRESCFILNPVP